MYLENILVYVLRNEVYAMQIQFLCHPKVNVFQFMSAFLGNIVETNIAQIIASREEPLVCLLIT